MNSILRNNIIMIRPARHGHAWSQNEFNDVLRELESATIGEVAAKHGRTPGSITAKLQLYAAEQIQSGKSISEVMAMTKLTERAVESSNWQNNEYADLLADLKTMSIGEAALKRARSVESVTSRLLSGANALLYNGVTVEHASTITRLTVDQISDYRDMKLREKQDRDAVKSKRVEEKDVSIIESVPNTRKSIKWNQDEDNALLEEVKTLDHLAISRIHARSSRAIKQRLLLLAYNMVQSGDMSIQEVSDIVMLPIHSILTFAETRKEVSAGECDENTSHLLQRFNKDSARHICDILSLIDAHIQSNNRSLDQLDCLYNDMHASNVIQMAIHSFSKII